MAKTATLEGVGIDLKHRVIERPTNVADGSNSEVGGRNREVRFTPESRLNSDIAACPKGAKPRHRAPRESRWRRLFQI
jgi:hypothetical protein